ncbi:MAG: IS630 family transposase [Deltaproteobacteria bacterium]|nr:IS630 family transposase [Deltaproteobacteria bacterium]
MDPKKKALVATERERPEVQRARTAWVEQQIPSLHPFDLIFLDESGANLGMTPRYGYAPRGERAVDHAPKHGGKNLTLIAGISLRGTLAPRVLTGSLGGSEFLHWVTKDLAPCLWPGAVVILDNLSTHSVDGVRAAIEARGARLLALPPYSPDLNPIEHCWSKIKTILRRLKPRSLDAFLDAVAQALKAVSLADIAGWMIHCGY